MAGLRGCKGCITFCRVQMTFWYFGYAERVSQFLGERSRRGRGSGDYSTCTYRTCTLNAITSYRILTLRAQTSPSRGLVPTTNVTFCSS